jgi:hypothetical protein
VKITQADIAFSWCVRERVDWICEKCGTQYFPPTTALQCSHFFGRENHAVRYYPDNAFAHCYGCHRKLGNNAYLFDKWAEKQLGKVAYNRVVKTSNNLMLGKLARHSEKEIAKHYRKELERMQELRSQGVTGRIEFEDWQ